MGKYLKVTATEPQDTGYVSSEQIGPVPRVPLVSIGNIAGTARLSHSYRGPATTFGGES